MESILSFWSGWRGERATKPSYSELAAIEKTIPRKVVPRDSLSVVVILARSDLEVTGRKILGKCDHSSSSENKTNRTTGRYPDTPISGGRVQL